MTVNHTEQAKSKSMSYWDRVDAATSTESPIEDYVRGSIDMETLVDRLQRETASISAVEKGLEAAGVSPRSIQNITEALYKTKIRTKGRLAVKQPKTAGQKLLTGLLSPPTKYQSSPTEPDTLYKAISTSIRKNQRNIQMSAIPNEDAPSISKPS